MWKKFMYGDGKESVGAFSMWIVKVYDFTQLLLLLSY